MLCQSCNKNNATTHVKTIVNGEQKEYMLCSECTKKLGYTNPMDLFSFNLGNFLGSFFEDVPSSSGKLLRGNEEVRCKQCGSTFSDISKSGKIGCATCYETFKKKLLPFIERIHGNTTHVGKIPFFVDENIKLKSNIKTLTLKLKEAVEKQEFEEAARLRDEINRIKGQVQQNEKQ